MPKWPHDQIPYWAVQSYFIMLEFANNKYTANYHISSFQELEAKQAVSQDWVLIPVLLLISQVTSAESPSLSGPLSPQL